MTNHAATVLTAIGVGLLTLPLLRYAAWRSTRQPLPHDLDAERDAIDHFTRHPLAAGHDQITADSFTHPTFRHRWMALTASPDREDTATTTTGGDHDDSYDPAPTEISPAVQRLIDLADDRQRYPGSTPVQPCDQAPYLERPAPVISRKRTLLTVIAGSIGGGLCASLATDPIQFAATLVMLLGAIAVALVDHDTLFLDLPTWVAAVIIAGCGAVAFNYHPDQRSWLLLAAIAAGAWVVALELLNLAYRVLRGITGLGFGDTLIAAGTTFCAMALTRHNVMALWAVLSGMMIALTISGTLMVVGRRGTRDAFALGPYLAGGWPVAWFVAHHTGAW